MEPVTLMNEERHAVERGDEKESEFHI